MSYREHLFDKAVELLKELISLPSLSKEEDQTADCIERFLIDHSKQVNRKGNNIWSVSNNCPKDAPVLLLNSHHDTVKATGNWSKDPYTPVMTDDRIYGLGSNDAGGSVVSLLATYLHLSMQSGLPYRLILAITAEEEISGADGVGSILDDLGPIDLAIVGEPTDMQLAVAEKGLVVLDCVSTGKSGHAAREEGENALYAAIEDINWIRKYRFPEISSLLGPVKMTVTQIQAGSQHNVLPANCEFVVDVRTNEYYSNQEVVDFIQNNLKSRVTPRSIRLNSSGIALEHPVVQKGRQLGLTCFGSATLSDQTLMDFNSVKIGPGQSARSHTADEFILLSEIKEGIATYINLLTDLNIKP